MPTAAAGPSKHKIDTATSTGTAERAARVERICRLIEHSDTPPTLKELARQEGISPHHLHRIFRAETGLTPKAYANGHRAQRLRDRKSTRLNSSHVKISYAVFCLKKK